MEIRSIETIDKTATEFLQVLASKYPDKKCIAFYGAMGVGKTTFITELCRQLKVIDNVTSPSFAIINEYETANDSTVYHFDFYRIKDLREAFDLGYEDYFFSGNFCLIEWPEKVESILPEECLRVKITENDNSTRKITINE